MNPATSSRNKAILSAAIRAVQGSYSAAVDIEGAGSPLMQDYFFIWINGQVEIPKRLRMDVWDELRKLGYKTQVVDGTVMWLLNEVK